MDSCVLQCYDLLNLDMRLKFCNNFKTINIGADELCRKSIYVYDRNSMSSS
jgi:hypothetical protein